MRKSRRQVTINSRSVTAHCGSCSSVMLPTHSVCKRCGGLAADDDQRVNYERRAYYDRPAIPATVEVRLEDFAPAWARPNPERVPTILGCWPFGAADPSDSPAIAILTEPAVPGPRLEPVVYPNDVPAQRVAMPPIPSVILT